MNDFENLGLGLLVLSAGLGIWAAIRKNQPATQFDQFVDQSLNQSVTEKNSNLMNNDISSETDRHSSDAAAIAEAKSEGLAEVTGYSASNTVNSEASMSVTEPIPLPVVPPKVTEAVNEDDRPTATPTCDAQVASTPKVAAIGDREFSVATFKQTFTEAVLQLSGRSLARATVQDSYGALVAMVQEQLQLYNPEVHLLQPKLRIVVQLAPEFTLGPLLESNLINLGIANGVYQGLQELGLDLNAILDLEDAQAQQADDLGWVMGGYLESLATANLPAIGYSTAQTIHQTVPNRLWAVEQTGIKYGVKLGGETQVYTGAEGRLQVRWISETGVQGMAHDTLVLGYRTPTVNLRRSWQIDSSDHHLFLSLPSHHHLEAQALQQQFVLVSCTIQDLIRLHLQAGESIETLHERFVLQLSHLNVALVIAELMHWLVDEYGLAWQQAWSMTQRLCAFTVHDRVPAAIDQGWTIAVLKQLLPRHLEIIYEINRRFLEEIAERYPGETERIQRLSLIDESGDRSVRLAHLACLGSHAVNVASALVDRPLQNVLQRSSLADFVHLYPEQFRYRPDGINLRRYLLQSNPRLANLISRWIGEDWITQPQELQKLEDLIQNVQFCGDWWQVKRAIKQDCVDYVNQQTELELNINSLFDVQAMLIAADQRQLLNLLHVLTLYNRLKTNATTDTIQHFTHRSVPRTCVFVGSVAADPIAQSIAQLLQAVATTINTDPDVQGKLQVVVLIGNGFQTLRNFYGAADLVEYLPLPQEATAHINHLAFTLNGAAMISSFNADALAWQQQMGTKHCFLFGMNTAELNHLQATGYNPLQFYSRYPELQQVIQLIASGYFSFGDPTTFKNLGNWLLTEDPALVLADYYAYLECQERVSQSYQDQKSWTRFSILSTVHTALFSSDRTIYHKS